MTTPNLLSLVALAIIFALWVYLAALAMIAVSRKTKMDVEETGKGSIFWLRRSFANHIGFLFGKRPNPLRRRLLFVTILMFSLIVGRAVYLTP